MSEQSEAAMKLAASTGMTLKEAWAKVKAEGGGSSPAPSAEERGEHTLASIKAHDGAW